MAVRNAIQTVCRACRVLKARGCQHQVTRPSYEIVGRHGHPSLGPEKSNQKLGCCCCGQMREGFSHGEGPFTSHPLFPGPEIQALGNLGLGRQPEGPGLELP